MTETEPTNTADVTYADLSAFQRDVLFVLRQLERSEEDSYGLAIKRRLEARYGEEVNHGRLYPNLDDLVELGLVERGEIDKRTNRYTLTDDGESLLRSHADTLDELLDRK
ncbi:PadR family transcriptional regulator [Halorientalis halophila]|uniref:PadR family transcriptional regulator n=1 Tax=Halorientalis halophila TaxID=3108499 RepID=UPI00300BD8C7